MQYLPGPSARTIDFVADQAPLGFVNPMCIKMATSGSCDERFQYYDVHFQVQVQVRTLQAKTSPFPSGTTRRASKRKNISAARVLCMTGTPIHNGPEDASGQLCAMGSGNQLEDSALFGKRAALNRDAVRDFTERFVYTSSLLEAGITLPLKPSSR